MLTDEKSEKILEAEAKTLSMLENTYRGLCLDIAKWRKKGVKKYKKEILAAIAELDAFEAENWVRLVAAQKVVGEKDEEIGKDEKLIEALEDYRLRLWGCLNQARKLAEEFTVKRALEQNSPLCDFLERLERILGDSGSEGGSVNKGMGEPTSRER